MVAPGGPILSGDTLLAFVDASAGMVRSPLSPEEVISGKQQYDGGWGLGLADPGLFCLWLLVEALDKP